MIFYEISLKLLNRKAMPTRAERSKEINRIENDTDGFCKAEFSGGYISVCEINYNSNNCKLFAVEKTKTLNNKLINDYIEAMELNAEIRSINEITLMQYCGLVESACRNDFLFDSDIPGDAIDLELFCSRRNRREFDECVVKNKLTQKQILQNGEVMLCDENLTAELNRIYSGETLKNAVGHPVHYVLVYDDKKTKENLIELLISALYQRGRLESLRCSLPYISEHHNDFDAAKKLYRTSFKATIVLDFNTESTNNREYASPYYGVMKKYCNIAKEYKNSVLTIFCVKRKCEQVKDILCENLCDFTLIPIASEPVFNTRAKNYLKKLAAEQGVTPNKILYAKIEDGKSYNSKDLAQIFEDWYDNYLRTKIFKQYAQIATQSSEIAKQKPKGLAIDELNNLIGLSEVKQIVSRALDFYKAQKLYESKGFKHNRPAMHMVFKGNPGTAKTTVARLFASVMKDNKLLSTGKLHEVGRADLVGQYVGHTAPKVKDAFKFAQGGVLFIDEAYSLVDDKDGLYGDEAINTIVQEMENRRDDLIVIFAGYPDKMEQFLQKNPGLRSRIAFHVPFADYNAQELCEITNLIAEKQDMFISQGVSEKLSGIFDTAIKLPDFGNGRYARNLFEKAIMRKASRLVNMDADSVTKHDVITLFEEDFEAEFMESKAQVRRIGF